jgi:membrane-associated phospholipid phosphatase
LPLVLFVAALSLTRRSVRPVCAMAVVCAPVILATFGSKWAMAYWDTSTSPVAHGSFPSGHTVSVVLASGVVVLLLRPGTAWGWVLPAVMGCVMGSALVLASVHPVTDVLGAGLLAAAALTWAVPAALGEWASDSRARGLRKSRLMQGGGRHASTSGTQDAENCQGV